MKPDVAIAGTKGYPYITSRADELAWLTGSSGTPAGSKLVTNLKLVGDFLVAQSRLTAAPNAASLTGSIDSSFATKAWTDPACSTV